jgi:hypothetical protein
VVSVCSMHNSQLCISPIHLGHSSFAPVCVALGGSAPTEPLALHPVRDIVAWLEGTGAFPLHCVIGNGGAH